MRSSAKTTVNAGPIRTALAASAKGMRPSSIPKPSKGDRAKRKLQSGIRSPCVVEEMGRRLAHINSIEVQSEETGEIDRRMESAQSSMMLALSDASPFFQAKSALGALFQIASVSGLTEQLESHAAPDNAHGAEDVANSIDAALWSVRRFIEEHFQISAETVGASFHMHERASQICRIERAAEAAKKAPSRDTQL